MMAVAMTARWHRFDDAGSQGRPVFMVTSTTLSGSRSPKGEVRLTTDPQLGGARDRKYAYKFPIDQNGDYKGTGIAPGNYVLFVFQGDKSLDFNDSVILAPAATTRW